MGDLLGSFLESMRVRSKPAEKTRVGLWGQSIIPKAVWGVTRVPEIRKNLVSGFLLNKAGFTQIIGANLYTITKNGTFAGKGYATDGMFTLNVYLNKISPSVYFMCDFNI